MALESDWYYVKVKLPVFCRTLECVTVPVRWDLIELIKKILFSIFLKVIQIYFNIQLFCAMLLIQNQKFIETSSKNCSWFLLKAFLCSLQLFTIIPLIKYLNYYNQTNLT